MRILVTGASGLLGLNLGLRFASEQEITGVVYSHSFSHLPFPVIAIDLSDEKNTGKLIEQSKPDLVINCAAMANLEDCEKKPLEAHLLNGEFPGWLAEKCERHSIKLVHISTDAVFDGTKNGKYSETDIPHPLSVYAQSKLAGELAVRQIDQRALVLRVNFYGFSPSGQRSLAEFFLRNLENGTSIKGFTDVFFSPLYVIDLVEYLMHCVEKELAGLYHLCSSESLSKYDFGLRIARVFNLNGDLISPITVSDVDFMRAPRSKNLVLDAGKIEQALARPTPSQDDGLARFYHDFQDGYAKRLQTLI